MHQVAILTNSHAVLGNVNDPVTITALEKLFNTSAAANSGVGYKCADPNCGVPVKAVITVLTKMSRKNSPASYFAAKVKSHIQGCTRRPKPTMTTASASTPPTKAASPNRTARPVIWVDPRAQAANNGATATTTSGSGMGAIGTGRKRSGAGSGITKGRSQMVESYAIEWQGMTTADKQGEELSATWNPGGTYFSAFHPIKFYPTVDVTTLGENIFVGTFKSVIQSKTGYVITLAEKNSTGEPLWVWVQSATFSVGASGAALLSRLAASVNSPAGCVGKRVYALERFSRQANGNKTWTSIPVVHPHMMWIE